MSTTSQVLAAPFPWFGGKKKVAHLVWERFAEIAARRMGQEVLPLT